jgi:anti-sigma factor ChrR (cupin superfamily)
MALHEFGDETVRMVKFEPDAKVEHDPQPGGEEVLVLEGVLKDENGIYPTGTWLRQPDGSDHAPWSDDGCVLWVKRGHLPPA